MTWNQFIEQESKKNYFRSLQAFIEFERTKYDVFPPTKLLFRAFELCPLSQVVVVILGQDPYPTIGHANGLAFSVDKNVKPLPKSLQNIFKELQADLGIEAPENGDLEPWAKQGVLLLNTVLTVRAGCSYSHAHKGWEQFTNTVIEELNKHSTPIAFMLWGKNAREKKSLISNPNHLILESVHPSPLSVYRGYFGSRQFSQVNAWLEKMYRNPIAW